MSLYYNSNKNLKSANVPVPFTQDQVLEWARCKQDPIYFIKNYVKIVSLDHGLVKFALHKYQENLISTIHSNRKTIARLARQMGKTTTVAAYIVWYVLFNDTKTVAILANKAITAREILGRVQQAYEHLPRWMQQGVVEWNKGSFELENGSRVIAAATSSSGIRGYSINLLVLDEFAFVPTNIAEDFFISVLPTISSGETTKMVITSTPKGLNHFYKLWVEAEQSMNGFTPFFAPYTDHPARGEKWAQEQRNALGEVKYRQEVLCDFLGSSDTLINVDKLVSMPIVKGEDLFQGYTQFEDVEQGHNYVMTVDTSRGSNLDYSAFLVVDVTSVPYKVVARYRSATIQTLLYPNVIHKIATKYNNAYVLVETNDLGQQVADILYYDLEYEFVYCSTKDSVKEYGSKSTPGIRTTVKTKRVGCEYLKTLVENDKLQVRDYEIIHELSNFIRVGATYKADEGKHDDLAMCLVIFGYLTSQPLFVELSDSNARSALFETQIKQVEDELVPFGFIEQIIPEEEKAEVFDGDLWLLGKNFNDNPSENW